MRGLVLLGFIVFSLGCGDDSATNVDPAYAIAAYPTGAGCPSCTFFGAGCTFGPGVWGHLDTGMVDRLNGLGTVTSVAARVTRDGVAPLDFGLGSTMVPDPFWLGQPGPAAHATISFTIRLSGIPGVASVTTSAQDMPVLCP